MTALISGLGIAGPALAHWLLHRGFEPAIIERAPRVRVDGYLIDFWGTGYDISEKMGLLPQIREAGYAVREVRLVDEVGHRVGGFDADLFRRATLGRYTSLSRGALCEILYRSIRDRAEVTFGDSITRLVDSGAGVGVEFEHGAPRQFDMVIGADGLHSVVRALAFGPERQFERYLGYTVAAYELRGYPRRDENVYVAYTTPGHQVARFSLRGDRTLVLLIAWDPGAAALDFHDPDATRAYLMQQFAGLGWECEALLGALDASDALYADRVSQIRMERWTKGRIALVGDAACAPSLLAGQGSALGLIGAYVLAGELGQNHEPGAAFAAYDARLRAFMTEKQDAAIHFGSAFAPRTRLGVFVRNQISKLLGLSFMSRRVMGAGLLDRLTLPDYGLKPAA